MSCKLIILTCKFFKRNMPSKLSEKNCNVKISYNAKFIPSVLYLF